MIGGGPSDSKDVCSVWHMHDRIGMNVLNDQFVKKFSLLTFKSIVSVTNYNTYPKP